MDSDEEYQHNDGHFTEATLRRSLRRSKRKTKKKRATRNDFARSPESSRVRKTKTKKKRKRPIAISKGDLMRRAKPKIKKEIKSEFNHGSTGTLTKTVLTKTVCFRSSEILSS